MKTLRVFIGTVAFLCSMQTTAIPARPGVWTHMTTSEGTTVSVELVGDEWMHYWRDADGRCYQTDNDGRLVSFEPAAAAASRLRLPRRSATVPDDYVFPKPTSLFQGEKRGLIILVNFSNNTFSMDDPQATYDAIANEPGYSEGNFKKSVRDYFLEQSRGQFDLSFDVVGPVRLPNLMSYYGGNNEYGNDQRPGEMVVDACTAVDSLVNFADYDWDNDGEVDQVFVLYAGYGEADGAPASTIWPHEWNLTDAIGKTVTFDSVRINTYACGNELDGIRGKKLAGIGVFCHEFSHCMGFPDFYDKYNFGMGAWDVMSNGARNGGGYNPAEYTAYERMICGWLDPIELNGATEVNGLKPIDDGGNTYIIYCDNANRQEYYLLENKNKNDIYPYNYSGHGLLVTHIDYDPELWYYNMPNTTATYWRIDGTKAYNTHQRMTIIAADNSTKAMGGYITDVYPIDSTSSATMEPNNALTTETIPAATQYLGGDEPVPFSGCELTDITRNDDGTINFWFRKSDLSSIQSITESDTSKIFYDQRGVQLNSIPRRSGLYIERTSEGLTRKVII